MTAPSAPTGAPAHALRALRLFALLFAVGVGALFFVVAFARIRYPFELEWMTGAILDHVDRVRAGLPVYAKPSADWIPFIYPPGYYWAAAWAGRVVPEPMAGRLVSIVATMVCAACVERIARRLGATAYWRTTGVALFFASFSYTCFWFDVERADALFVAFVAVGTAVLLESRTKLVDALSGALFALAFFVKQPATTFLVLVPAALAVGGAWRRAIAFGAGAAAAFVPTYVALERSSGGWFSFYCVKVPASHGMEAKYVTLFLVSDLSKAFLLTMATAAFLAPIAWDLVRRATGRDRRDLVFGGVLAAGFVASATSRLHLGGWPNVLLFWTTFAAVAVAVVGARVEARAAGTAIEAGVRAALAAVVIFQVGAFATDPGESIPGAKNARYTARADDRLRAIERTSGEVLLEGRGHVTSRPHFHINALVDVLRMGAPIPDDLRDGIRAHRFAAIVLNDMHDLSLVDILGHESELFELVTREYFVAERLDDREPDPVVGFGTRPRWVLRPRANPLGALDHAGLERRQTIEMGLAERNMRAAQADPSLASDGIDVEALAAY